MGRGAGRACVISHGSRPHPGSARYDIDISPWGLRHSAPQDQAAEH